MKKRLFDVFIVIAFIITGMSNAFALTPNIWFKKGQSMFCKGEYFKSINSFKKACNDGYGKGCGYLAIMKAEGIIVPTNYPKKTFNIYKRKCEKNDMLGCVALASIFECSIKPPMNHKKSIPLLKRACNNKMSFACYELGKIYSGGVHKESCTSINNSDSIKSICFGSTKDMQMSEKYYRIACGYNNSMACYELGFTTIDTIKKTFLFEKSCNGENADACVSLGDMYINGAIEKNNYNKAADFYKKACSNLKGLCGPKGGISEGCYKLGVMYVLGLGGQKNYIKAVKLLKRSCSIDSEKCYFLYDTKGLMYYSGINVKQNYKQAIKLFKKACTGYSSLGQALGCEILGFMYYKGVSLPRDLIKSSFLYENACKQSIGGCILLGDVYAGNNKDKRNYVKAVKFYKKAINFYNNTFLGSEIAITINEKGINYINMFSAFRKRCNNGNIAGCIALGYLHEKNKNYWVAINTLDKICKKGYSSGCYLLGKLYRELGISYYEGKGVTLNKIKAYEYLMKAAKRGDVPAQHYLDTLCKQSPWACK